MSAVTKPPFNLPVIVVGVLRIVYQQVCTFCEGDEICIMLFLPFHVGRKDETPTGVLNAIEARTILGVTGCAFADDAHIGVLDILAFRPDDWLQVPMSPGDMLSIGDCVKCATGG